MPPKEPKLKDESLKQLAVWIDLGAPYDKPLLDKAVVKKPMTVSADDRKFWSFAPLRNPQPPPVKDKDAAWSKTAVDAFILAKQQEKGLTPSKLADKRKLIRRATFDLIGLPPTPEEIEAFLKDEAPDAYEKLLDRLLASPHYGERWARHWLDLARYAESHGFEHDYDRPTAYPYRDFVIKALNNDLPYDKFVQWQIAGDELEPDNPLALAATGFLGAGVHSTQITANQVEKERYDELDDIVRTMGTAMLGLTIGCARCHDHKYDPIPTKDYYRLLSTFTTTVRTEIDLPEKPDTYKQDLAKYEADHKPLVDALKAVTTKWFPARDPEYHKCLDRVKQHELKAKPKTYKAMICSEGLPAVRLHTQGEDFLKETHFLKRGDPNQKEEVMSPGFAQVLERGTDETRWQVKPPPGSRLSYRRRGLAAWLTDVDQGAGHLLARVIVNRMWQHHFGRGIVATPSDFGLQGEKPTHPELLDYLANQLIAHDWKLKPIHKLMMASAVYRQGDDFDPKKAELDPENKLLWRRVPHRLEAEIIRDAMLAASGALDPKMYGPGTLDPNQKRRAIYFFVKRSQLIPSMVLFDGPDALQGIEQRTTTTIAPQALLMINSKQVRACAEALVKRIAPAEGKSADAVKNGYLITLGRQPTATELKETLVFIEEQIRSYKVDNKTDAAELAWADFAQVLLGLNEFVYVD